MAGGFVNGLNPSAVPRNNTRRLLLDRCLRLCRVESMPPFSRGRQPGGALKTFSSEDKLPPEPERALATKVAGLAGELRSARRPRDDPKVRLRDICLRVAEIRCIRDGERIYSELELQPLRDREISQEASIQVKEARPAKDVPSSGAVTRLRRRRGGDLRERTHLKIVTRRVRRGTVAKSASRWIVGLDIPQNNDRAD